MVATVTPKRFSETSWLEINLSAIDHNVAAFKSILSPGCELAAVVKADGYGLGAIRVARRLVSRGVNLLAVYDQGQATELAKAGITADLLILMPLDHLDRTDTLYRTAVAGRLHLTVHSIAQADRIEAIGQSFGCPLRIHVEVDTGMSRAGMPETEAERLLRTLPGRRYLKLAGIFSHASSADENISYTENQHSRFENLLKRNAALIGPDVRIHFSGTYAALRDRAYHHRAVRIGLGLLGYGQHDLGPGSIISEMPALQPSLRWLSRVVHVLEVPTGTPVGYGGQFVTKRQTRLGLVPAGYADGYPLTLSNRGIVRLGPDLRPAPVRGRVNMDQLIIDLTDLPELGLECPVEIYSDNPDAPNAVHRLAELAQTNCYEILCRLCPRLTRRYLTTEESTGRIGQVALT